MRGGHYSPDYWKNVMAYSDQQNAKMDRYNKVVHSHDPDGRYKNLKDHMLGILHEYPRTVMGSTRDEFELQSQEDFNNLRRELHSLVSRSKDFTPETVDSAIETFLSSQNVKFRAERQKGLFGGGYGRELVLSEPLGLSYIHYRKPKANGNNVVLLKNGKVKSEYYISVPFDDVHNELRRVIFGQSRRAKSRSPRLSRSPKSSRSRRSLKSRSR